MEPVVIPTGEVKTYVPVKQTKDDAEEDWSFVDRWDINLIVKEVILVSLSFFVAVSLAFSQLFSSYFTRILFGLQALHNHWEDQAEDCDNCKHVCELGEFAHTLQIKEGKSGSSQLFGDLIIDL